MERQLSDRSDEASALLALEAAKPLNSARVEIQARPGLIIPL
jgi:hypothetical protein